MRYLNRIYFEKSTLEVLHLYTCEEGEQLSPEEIDATVFPIIGNDPKDVSVLVFSQLDEDVEAQLIAGLVPSIKREGDDIALTFVPRQEDVFIPTYGELFALWEELEAAL